ncbi:cytochrome c oxidase assembly protein [Brevundimonas sp. PAMC22021]|uniref:cytochrome c oxidase assembly protein n=1 Tax=Brevundimonas sp. PAMC22021 TaxID=2861285 RepID=UPI001C63A2CE|nr:cytochrome c oxidase assembly protein [Brevundimonas sp. PAMC22021]QYF87405.1 cytochrome c oxidase assembly protein [Brevundimonas sp. PAMC22021]
MNADVIWTPYCGQAPDPSALLRSWNLDPWLLAALAAGFVALWTWRQGVVERRAAVFALAVLVLGFVSPLCALSSALFSARTVHHVLLIAVAAPLIALAMPKARTGSLAGATAVQAAVFWAWHAPQAYGGALSSDAVYWLMQLSILGSGVWFWAAARAASAPAAVIALLAAMLLMGLLGALLTFAGTPIYAPHFGTTMLYGLTPLEDQQNAGLIMWAPAAALYLFAALWRLGRMLSPPAEGAAA